VSEAKTNLQVLLKSRPLGVPQAEHFELVRSPVSTPTEGQVLIRIAYVSVDPAMRGWVNAAANYAQPVPVGAVMKSFAVGRVLASRHPQYQDGDLVTGLFGWQEYAVVDAAVIDRKLDAAQLGELPLSAAMGVLGLNGVTAYFGVLEIGQPRPGQTVVVSSAAGSVGSCAGQIAKLAGCRTVGIAGGADKVRMVKEQFGFDAAVDYKSPHFEAELRTACPRGVDMYFDNTSGKATDVVTSLLNTRARVVICGTVAFTDWDPPPIGPRIDRKLLVARARMEGFIAPDYQHRWNEAYAQLARWLKAGQIKVVEEVLEGLVAAPDSVAGLYRGENMGKRVIRVAEIE